jgi:hypothetical protein
MGKYKYTAGMDDDTQAGGVLFGGVAGDRKAVALEGEDLTVERPSPVRQSQRRRAVRVTSLPKKFVPERLPVIESPSSST